MEKKFLTKEWIRNEIVLQQLDSDVCGDYCVYFLKKISCMENPSLEFLKRNFDDKDQFSNDYRVWEKIHSNFPKTLDKIEHDIKIEDVSDKKILSVIKNSLKEDRQICKPRNQIKTHVTKKRKYFLLKPWNCVKASRLQNLLIRVTSGYTGIREQEKPIFYNFYFPDLMIILSHQTEKK